MSKSLEEHADDWDLRHEDFNDNGLLYDVYSEMRERAPFIHTDHPFFGSAQDGAWMAVRYEECQKILKDWQHFSSKPASSETVQPAFDFMLTLDPPRQQAFRKVLNPYFSPSRIKQMQSQICTVTDKLIDEIIESGAGDLATVAWRQPGIVFFKYMLGMPIHDVPLCIELTDTALNGDTEESRLTAWGRLYQHINGLVDARGVRSSSEEDLIDVLLNAEIDGKRLERHDVVGNAMLLVQAGLETTASAMSFAFHYLASHREQRDQLVRQPDSLPVAVEEFIRFAGSIHGIPRTVAKQVELGGRTFRAGESVLVNFAAANRDSNRFDEPHRCILDRQENRHLGFGAGVHQCLGVHLARLEFQVGLAQVLSRMPDYRLAPGEESVFRGNTVIRGYRSIPIVFTPGGKRFAIE